MRLFYKLLFLFLLCSSASASTVHFALTNWNVTTATNSIIITPTNGPVVNHPFLQVGNPIRILTTTGQATTNLLTGTYLLTIYNIPYFRPLLFTVPNDTNTYELTQLLTNGFSASIVNPPFVTAVIAGNNVTTSTNGGAVTVNSTGSGGSFNGSANQFGTSATAQTIIKAGALTTNQLTRQMTNTGPFTVRDDGGSFIRITGSNGVVTLLESSEVPADVVAARYIGDGSLLTGLNASSLASGTVPAARLGLTNNTDLPGVVVGNGIGTNVSSLLSTITNNTSPAGLVVGSGIGTNAPFIEKLRGWGTNTAFRTTNTGVVAQFTDGGLPNFFVLQFQPTTSISNEVFGIRFGEGSATGNGADIWWVPQHDIGNGEMIFGSDGNFAFGAGQSSTFLTPNSVGYLQDRCTLQHSIGGTHHEWEQYQGEVLTLNFTNKSAIGLPNNQSTNVGATEPLFFRALFKNGGIQRINSDFDQVGNAVSGPAMRFSWHDTNGNGGFEFWQNADTSINADDINWNYPNWKLQGSIMVGTNGGLEFPGVITANSNGVAVSGMTNRAVGATKVIVTDANGAEHAATLSGLTLVGTTLTAVGGSGTTPTFDVTQFGGPVDGTNIISGAIFTNITIRGNIGPTNALYVNQNMMIYSNGFTSLIVSNDAGGGLGLGAAIDFRLGATNFERVDASGNITFGYLNGIANSGLSTIAGGVLNSNRSAWSFIGGGSGNMIQSTAAGEVIVGGQTNTIGASGVSAGPNVIGGGDFNYIDSSYSVIGGGYQNALPTQSKLGQVISGGYFNTNTGNYGVIPGGFSNLVTAESGFAAGSRALAAHAGAFVWADTQGSVFSSPASDTFNIRAQGGMNLRGGGATTGLLITNAVGANQGTVAIYATGTNGLIYVGTNNPAIANGFINGTNATQIDVPGVPQGALNVHSNGTVYINGSGAGNVVLGNTAHTFNTTITAPNATAARTLTAPDLSGTIAVTDTAQTFSAIEKFSAEVDFTGATNYIAGDVRRDGGLFFPTNMTRYPNFNKGWSLTNVAAAYTMGGPAGVDTTLLSFQQTLYTITNTSGSAIAVTLPANLKKATWWGTNIFISNTGIFYVTNATMMWWTCRPGETNVYIEGGY